MTIRVVSLFCGLGGADLGLYRAADELGLDVQVVDAIDNWEPAVRVYNANLPHPVARIADVKELSRADLPPHDLVIGGPPCQDHSIAGQRRCKCNIGGPAVARCCLADFIRLADESAWLMENTAARLIHTPWSDKLCAADYGDVTTRRRWFYSNYLLHVMPTPGPRRVGDIRDPSEDERVLKKRGNVCKAGNHSHYEDADFMASQTAHSWHGHDIRGHGKLMPISGRRETNRAITRNHLQIGLRGNSASAFKEDEFLGSLLSNAWHANEASKLIGCRNPSLLEMQRAHSIPETFDWVGVNKTDRGQLIANCWPIGMATAVGKSIISAITGGV